MVRSSPQKTYPASASKVNESHQNQHAPKRIKLGDNLNENRHGIASPSSMSSSLSTKNRYSVESRNSLHSVQFDSHRDEREDDHCPLYQSSSLHDHTSLPPTLSRGKEHNIAVSSGGQNVTHEVQDNLALNSTRLSSKLSHQSTTNTSSKSTSYQPIRAQNPSTHLLTFNSSLGIAADRSGIKSSMRNFSKMVCQKLEEVQTTSYNEISDNLIHEFSLIDTRTDQKNIRRRVYDVLNVLHSIGIIEKDKRHIKWIGFPSEIANGIDKVEMEKSALERKIQEKRKALQMYLQRFVALNRLIQRNKHFEYQQSSPDYLTVNDDTNASSATSPQDKLLLPFILISAPKDCRIDCEMLEDRTQYFFEFDMPFAIHEDMEVLKMLGLDKVTRQQLLSFVNPFLAKYYPEWLLM